MSIKHTWRVYIKKPRTLTNTIRDICSSILTFAVSRPLRVYTDLMDRFIARNQSIFAFIDVFRAIISCPFFFAITCSSHVMARIGVVKYACAIVWTIVPIFKIVTDYNKFKISLHFFIFNRNMLMYNNEVLEELN